ncbi:MAG: cellulase family glycosylhydrolase [Opitutales bacterium]|nr:cellulase family glycosylhydrolase [Opitutales bacterium]
MKTKLISILLLTSCLMFSGCQSSGGYIKVSDKNPNYTELSDGTPYIAIGYNLSFPRWWDKMSEDECFEMIETHMKNIHENGGNYVRVWFSHPFYEIEDQKAGVYNPKKIARVKRFMDLAQKYDLRVKICIEHFRNIKKYIPNENESGLPRGLFERKAYDGEFKAMKEYFGSARGKELFLKRFKFLADMFRDNPNVYAWELWNEFNTTAAGPYSDLLLSWQEEMFAKLRKECPNHLVVNSYGSFDGDSSARTYKFFSKETTNEIAPIHRYLDEGATYGICQAPVDVFSADAIDTIKIIYPNKPAYLAETGGVQPRHSGPIRFYDMDKDGIIFHDAFYTPFFRGSAGSGQPWHWDVYIHKHGLWKHIKPFSQLVKGVNPIAENFKPTRLDTKRCRVWTIDGKKTILAFVRDSSNDWKSEFLDGKKPVDIVGENIDFSKLVGNREIANVRVYDLWNGTGPACAKLSPKVELPTFKRSIAIRIDLK